MNMVYKIYKDRGFIINSLVMDVEFECIRDKIKSVGLETVDIDDHVGDIEASMTH